MSRNRGGRPATHGARQIASQFAKERISTRTRRQVGKLHRTIASKPIEATHALLIGRIARKELIAQHAEAGLLAVTDLEQAQGLAKFATWTWNSWRRDVELLSLLEEKVERDSTPTLAEYLASKSQEAASAPPPAQEATVATDPVFSRVLDPAATGTGKSSGTEKPDPAVETSEEPVA
jgi:hypothetical protein